MKSYPNKSTLVFYFFSMFILGGLFRNIIEFTILKRNPYMEKSQLQILTGSILQLLIYVIIFIGVIILMGQFYKDDFRHFKTKIGKFILMGVLGWLATYGILIVYSIILQFIRYSTEVPENQQVIQDTFFSYPWLMVPVLIIGAPFIEETIFRGIIFRTINNLKLPYKLNFIIAFLMSSLLFGLIHVLLAFLTSGDIRDIVDGIPYFVSGFVLTFLYYKSKNIYVPMIAHFLHNTTATFIMFITMLLRDFLPEEFFNGTIYVLMKLLHLQ